MKVTDSKLLRQFRKWAKRLMRVNPDYVLDPRKIRDYITGPNWDDSDIEYAHYRSTVAIYGDELLEFFEKVRSSPKEEAFAMWRDALEQAGIKEEA